mmetsp:Transcript_2446/g.3629  ORF Transcript_2446/g.3629 Transcript_2446/m.3629 type:complete len:237 (+) Transcript_2446:1203-1913(+)
MIFNYWIWLSSLQTSHIHPSGQIPIIPINSMSRCSIFSSGTTYSVHKPPFHANGFKSSNSFVGKSILLPSSTFPIHTALMLHPLGETEKFWIMRCIVGVLLLSCRDTAMAKPVFVFLKLLKLRIPTTKVNRLAGSRRKVKINLLKAFDSPLEEAILFSLLALLVEGTLRVNPFGESRKLLEVLILILHRVHHACSTKLLTVTDQFLIAAVPLVIVDSFVLFISWGWCCKHKSVGNR